MKIGIVFAAAAIGLCVNAHAEESQESDLIENELAFSIEYDPNHYNASNFEITKRTVEKAGCTPVEISDTGYFGELITVSVGNSRSVDVGNVSEVEIFAIRHCGKKRADHSESSDAEINKATIEFEKNETGARWVAGVAELAGCDTELVRTELLGDELFITVDHASGNQEFDMFESDLGATAFVKDHCELN